MVEGFAPAGQEMVIDDYEMVTVSEHLEVLKRSNKNSTKKEHRIIVKLVARV